MTQFRIANLDPWYVNLDHRTDRRLLIEGELSRAGLSARRFSAMTKEDYRGPAANAANMQSHPDTIGNWLSFTYLFRSVQNTDRDLLLLEDDAILAPDIMDRFRYLEEVMPDDWDILFLCGTFHCNPAVWHRKDIGRDVEVTPVKHLLRAYGVFSNHGMVVRGSSSQKVLSLMNGVMPQALGSDHALILIQPQLNAYVFVPGCVFQRDMTSDVVPGGFTAFSNFLNMGPYVYQDKMTDFDPDGFDWKEAHA